MDLARLKFAWKYRKYLWKYRKLIRHRHTIASAAVAIGACAAALILLRGTGGPGAASHA